MKNIAANVLLVVLGLWLAGFFLAKPRNSSGAQPLAAVAVEREWEAVSRRSLLKPWKVPAGEDEGIVTQARQRQIAEYVDWADRLRDFRQLNKGTLHCHEAKRLEALALLYAEQIGDTSQDARRDQLVTAARRDREIPAKARVGVAAMADHLAINRQNNLSPVERIAAYERAARGLIADFPESPHGYQELLELAKAFDDKKAQALARELLRLPGPTAVRTEAQVILDRFTMIGHPLADLAQPVSGNENVLAETQGRQTVLYTWAIESKGSIAMAKIIAANVAPGVQVIGVNLDDDVVAAQAAAIEHALPGRQIYDPRGRMGALAQRLKLTNAPLVYLTDHLGNICSVSGHRDLAARLQTSSH